MTVTADIGSLPDDEDHLDGWQTTGDGRHVIAIFWKTEEDGRGTHRNLVAYAFGYTADGLVDLIGFHVEAVGDDLFAAMDGDGNPSRSTMAAAWRASDAFARLRADNPRQRRGLRSRVLRSAMATSGLLGEARRRLPEVEIFALDGNGEFVHPFHEEEVRRGRAQLTPRFLTHFAVRYHEHDGTRETFAKLHRDPDGLPQPTNARTIEKWIDKAKVLKLWATSGSGSKGAPTALAWQLAREYGFIPTDGEDR